MSAGQGRALIGARGARGALPAAVLALAVAVLAVMTESSSSAAGAATVFAGKGGWADAPEKWWHHAVIYQVYPRSFKDSDGDGIGDLKGITSQLEYLKDIGVSAVWLSPIYPSPQIDFGYDISDFKNVDPQYGTLDDFDAFAKKTHQLGMKVVLDLVPNHSSDQHEWFIRSARGEEKYKNYYMWHEGNKTNWDHENNRPGYPNNWVSHFRNSAWTWNEQRQAYFLHQFAVQQPDLNYRDPGLVEEIKDVFRFWMARGVDGFRIDALPFLFEVEDLSLDEPLNPEPSPDLDKWDYDFYTHPYTMDDPGTYDMLSQWRAVVDGFEPDVDRVTMTECYTTFDKTIEYYGTREKPGAHFTFNFQLISKTNQQSKATDFKSAIDEWMAAMDDFRWPNWVIGNHDNNRVADRYPKLGEGLNMISLTLPGTAMTYYGEEIGMEDGFVSWEETRDPQALNVGLKRYLTNTRDVERTPFQWDDTTSAGFSVNPHTWMPVNPNYWQLNVKNQKSMKRSHLSMYKDLLKARQTETMKRGDLTTKVVKDHILLIERSLAGHDTFVTLVNFNSSEIQISPEEIGNGKFNVYASSMNSKLMKGDGITSSITLRPKESLVLTTAAVSPSGGSSSASPASTDPPTPPNPPTSSTPKNGSSANRAAAALVALLMVLVTFGAFPRSN